MPFLGQHQSVPPPAHHSVRARGAPSGLLLDALGELHDLGVDFVARSDAFLGDDRAQREVGEHARAAPTRISSMNACGFLPGHLEVLLERAP